MCSNAAPNHWHAPATILACAAIRNMSMWKTVLLLTWRGRTDGRRRPQTQTRVQMGNQRRSWPWMIESIQRLHGGEIGEVLFARTWV